MNEFLVVDKDIEAAHQAYASGNILKMYMKEIGNKALLSAEEEIELCSKAQKGDAAARNKMVESNLRLVVMIAKQYIGKSKLSFNDLIQEGNLGLFKAIEKFDVERGCRFSTCAVPWIRHSITIAMLNFGRTIRVPVHMVNRYSKYTKTYEELLTTLGREPETEEIAKAMGLSVKNVKEIEALVKDPISLNAQFNDEDDSTLEEVVADTSIEDPNISLDNELLRKAIDKVMFTLTDREKEVITYRFGLGGTTPLTLEQLGDKYSLSKERVRQIEQKALTKLRNPIRADELRPHLA